MTKRIVSIVLSVVMIMGVMTASIFTTNAAKKKAQKITGVSSSYSKSVKAKNFTLKAKAKTKLTFKSSNKSVATVTKKGVVDVKKIGTATITITAKGNSKYKTAAKKVKINVGNITVKNQVCTRGSYTGDVFSVFTNYYNYPVEIRATAVFFDDAGKPIKTYSDSIYCLGYKESNVCHFSCPVDENYDTVPYAKYKVTYTYSSKNTSYATYTSYNSKITCKCNVTDTDLVVEAKNNGKTLKYDPYFAILFYDENKDIIGYSFRECDPDITKKGSTGYFDTMLPYDSQEGSYITPFTYKIFVTSAYTVMYKK